MINLSALLCNIQQESRIQDTFNSLRKLFSLALNAAGIKIKPEPNPNSTRLKLYEKA